MYHLKIECTRKYLPLTCLIPCASGLVTINSVNFFTPNDEAGTRFDEYMQKVVAIKGDIVEEDLGLSAEDKALLSREVSVIIHCAATISFTEPIQVISLPLSIHRVTNFH